jgi:hypothetical protein
LPTPLVPVCARTCPSFSSQASQAAPPPPPSAPQSAAHSPQPLLLSCSSCGTLKRHNVIAYGSLADHFDFKTQQGFDFLKEHTTVL